MICAACGYDDSIVDKVLFQRGPRKGQVKEEQKRRKFSVLTFVAETEDISMGDFRAPLYVRVDLDNHKTLYGCPECGTVRTELW